MLTRFACVVISISVFALAMLLESCYTELARNNTSKVTQNSAQGPLYDPSTNESTVEGVVKNRGTAYTRESVDPPGNILSEAKFIVNPISRMSGNLYLPTPLGESYLGKRVRIRGVISEERIPWNLGPGSGTGSVYHISVSEITIIE